MIETFSIGGHTFRADGDRAAFARRSGAERPRRKSSYRVDMVLDEPSADLEELLSYADPELPPPRFSVQLTPLCGADGLRHDDPSFRLPEPPARVSLEMRTDARSRFWIRAGIDREMIRWSPAHVVVSRTVEVR